MVRKLGSSETCLTFSQSAAGGHIKKTRSARVAGSLVVVMTLVSAMFAGTAGASHIPTVDLGTAESFAVLAGQGVTNTGPTVVQGDVGSFPNTSVGGFPPGLVQNGTINPSYTANAKDDLVTAYVDAAGRTPVTTIATELGGQVLNHGIYDSTAGTFGITGTLTLDAEGDPNAVWIFKAASTLITGSGSNVNLINGASPCNVFWVVGSSATLGTNSTLRGTILSLASITMTTGATLEGRALARNAAVTLDTNTITNGCAGEAPGSPTVTTQVSTAQVAVGGSVTDTATVADLAASPDRGSLVFSAYGPNDPTCAGQPAYTSNEIPVTSVGNGVYTSTPAFTPTVPGTYLFVVDYDGDSTNDAFATTCGDANETVTAFALPSVAVTKTASPGTLPEPGGSFTFTIGLTNTSAGPVIISSITDSVYGNLASAANSTCGALIGDTLAPGAAATCTFTGTFNGNAGATENDTATATVTGSGGQTATGSDEATVSLTDALPSLSVSKSASPTSRPEPGGNFTFTVVVTNNSVEPVRITSITDSIYGNLATLAGSTCGDGINMSLAAAPGPNNTFTCSFTVTAIGNNGAQETDRVTATGRDDEGNTTSGFDEATISITAPVVVAPVVGPVITVPVPIAPRIQVPAVVTPSIPAPLGVTPVPTTVTVVPTVAPAPATVAAPAPSATAKALVRTGTETLPMLGLACNLIVFGLLLLSPGANRRRYSRSHT